MAAEKSRLPDSGMAPNWLRSFPLLKYFPGGWEVVGRWGGMEVLGVEMEVGLHLLQ